MITTNTWSIAAAAFGLAAVASLGLFTAIWRRAEKGVATRTLLAAVLFLALHYGAAAGDAGTRTMVATTAGYTTWAAAGQALLLLFWVTICAFYFLVAGGKEKLSRSERFQKGLFKFVLAMVVVGLATIGTRLTYLVWSGVPAEAIQGGYAAITKLGGGWLILAPIALLALVARRVRRAERPALAEWLLRGEETQLTELQITGNRLGTDQEPVAPLASRDFTALSALVGIGIGVFAIAKMGGMTEPGAVLTVFLLRLSMLAALMGIVYYHTRFAFFDVMIKRGMLFVVLALCIGVITYIAFPAMMQSGAAPGGAAFCIVATVFVWLWTRFADNAERALDRGIFRRPDYRRELLALTEKMATCKTAAELSALVAGRMRDLLRTENATYEPEPRRPASAIVRIAAGGRVRGYLSLGGRDRGQPYGSEDLTFLDAVGAQFAAQMESLEARRAEELAATAELRALRAQINPHFLFNTLNTVAAMSKSTPEAERMILNLSRVFRSALESTRKERISLREELGCTRAFLEIESARFEEKLRYEITAPEDLMELAVPPLLIQPLVENAVKHGISPKLGGGRVAVVVERKGSGLSIEVTDDGVGFDPFRQHVNVGLANVRERVEREGGAWNLRSAPGAGTTISFDLFAGVDPARVMAI